jgi:hypothetical protein
MKYIAALLVALGTLNAAMAGEYLVQQSDCDKLATEAKGIATKHERGIERSEVLYHILEREKLNNNGYVATLPMLISITADLYAGTLKTSAKTIASEVSQMCEEYIGTPLQTND